MIECAHLRVATVFILVLLSAMISCGTQEPSSETTKSDVETSILAPIDDSFAIYTRETAVLEAARERRIMDAVKPSSCEDYLKRLTEKPHLAGTEEDRRTADFVAARFRSMGYSVEIEEYHVLLPRPLELSLEMLEPVAFTAKMREPAIELDPDTSVADVIPPYAAYSPDADLTAPIVFANYGRAEDFATLERLGISVRGAIVVMRYSKSYRGSKVWLAERYGAAGAILYSDPADDGFARGDVYPKGPWRPAAAVQRGSILYFFEYPGDPGTPGQPSRAGAEHLTFDGMTSLPAIPTMVLSAEDAEPILRQLDGDVVPEGWQGALPFTYHLAGRRPVRVRMRVTSDYRLRPIWNVVATWTGSVWPDEEVIVGNHRDAWVHGAVDPSSGTAVMLEAARVLAEGAANGAPPLRTIRFASWDGEEYGMIGSTEWGEERAASLMKGAVAYINADAVVSGPNFGASGSPLLERFLGDVMRATPGSQKNKSVMDETNRPDRPFSLGDLGSGSDFAVFFNHLGISSIDIGSGGPYGVYHSLYDTFGWMKRHGDPTFGEHAKMARLMALAVRRLSCAQVLPFDLENYGRWITARSLAFEKDHDAFDLSVVRSAAAQIESHGKDINERRRRLLGQPVDIAFLETVNRELRTAERCFLLDGGLSSRPWFRHALFAPDRGKGYGSIALPSLAEAAAHEDRTLIQSEAVRLHGAIERFRSQAATVAKMLERF